MICEPTEVNNKIFNKTDWLIRLDRSAVTLTTRLRYLGPRSLRPGPLVQRDSLPDLSVAVGLLPFCSPGTRK